MNLVSYKKYSHEYATWCSARAVQRGFVNSIKIKSAIEYAGLQNFEQELLETNLSFDVYKIWHRNKAAKILKGFLNENVSLEDATFGRAAKIIAIYIKTAHILGNPESTISRFAFPPIDRILLFNIIIKYGKNIFDVKPLNWTNFNEGNYDSIITSLKDICKNENLEFFWMIEKYWEIQ